MKKIVFSNSGGATKLVSLLEGNRILLQEFNIKPTDFCGVSAGAITAFLAAFSTTDWSILNIAIQKALHIKTKDFFEKSPIKENGDVKLLNAVWQIITKHNYLGIQNIKPMLTELVSEHHFNHFKKSPKTPNIWIQAVRPKDMKRSFWNLKDYDYQTALDMVCASSNIPVFAQPIQINKDDSTDLWLDGGIRNHNPSNKFIDLFGKDIEHLYSFYTRNNIVDAHLKPNWSDNVLNTLTVVMDGMIKELSKRDALYENLKAKELNFKLTQFFYPDNILQSQFDLNEDRLEKLFIETRKITYETLK